MTGRTVWPILPCPVAAGTAGIVVLGPDSFSGPGQTEPKCLVEVVDPRSGATVCLVDASVARLRRLGGGDEDRPTATPEPRVLRDHSVDAAIVHLVDDPRSARTVSLDEDRLVDLGSSGEPVMVELHEVSRGVNLAGLPDAARVGEALRARGIATRFY